MPVIKLLLALHLLFFSNIAWGRDQDWGIFQAVKVLPNNHVILAEWLRRDTGQLFDQRFFDYFRFSWGKKYGSLAYLIGGGYVKFQNKSDEKRLHQFIVHNHVVENLLLSRTRLGLEERFFDGDSNLYLRIRIRNQFNFLPQHSLGLAVYNELFIAPQGFNRFYTGFNENRFGFGPRYTTKEFEFYIYFMKNYIRTLQKKTFPTWGMLQVRYFF